MGVLRVIGRAHQQVSFSASKHEIDRPSDSMRGKGIQVEQPSCRSRREEALIKTQNPKSEIRNKHQIQMTNSQNPTNQPARGSLV